MHGLLRYAPPALESDALRATGACCGLGQPLASPLGIHGLHLFLTDETQEAEASVLLLTPAACARLRSDRATEHTGTRTCPLTEPLPALETKRHRAEFVVRDAVYGLDTPEPDLLTGLTIEVTVWRHS